MYAVTIPFFRWLALTAPSVALQSQAWAMPAAQVVHLIGLSLLGGSIVVLDLRLLNLCLTACPVSDLARSARPWFLLGASLSVFSGIFIVICEPLALPGKPAFWVKLGALAIALPFSIFGLQRAVQRDESGRATARALVSLSLWLLVAASGRWIGFS